MQSICTMQIKCKANENCLWWDSNQQPLHHFTLCLLEVQCATYCTIEPQCISRIGSRAANAHKHKLLKKKFNIDHERKAPEHPVLCSPTHTYQAKSSRPPPGLKSAHISIWSDNHRMHKLHKSDPWSPTPQHPKDLLPKDLLSCGVRAAQAAQGEPTQY